MTTRPTHPSKQKRNSAIYLGTDLLHLSSTPPGIPDLPEPPSPVSSNGSGLPSPPATNSTGSGSTGDPASIAYRKRPFSYDGSRMLSDGNVETIHAAFSGRSNEEALDGDDDDYENDYDHNENDEDDTAKLDLLNSPLMSSNENTLALERVKSLTQRNRMALDKLSSYSRNTPSPRASSSSIRSPIPSHASSSSSSNTASSSSSKPLHRSRYNLQPDHRSGSETERESLEPTHSHSNSSSSQTSSRDVRSSSRDASMSMSTRQRLKSAPDSPVKALRNGTSSASSGSNNSNSPSHRRKRASMAMTDVSSLRSPDYDDEITQSALDTVASARRSPTTSTAKKRTPLPREFRDGGTSSLRRSSVDGPSESNGLRHNGRYSIEPATPHRHSTNMTSSRPSTGRSSTVRDLTRRHQTRWLSEDYTSTSQVYDPSDIDDDTDPDSPLGPGRRQTLRGGSAESALTAGRSLVGEGLRAAGLSRRTQENQLFDSNGRRSPEENRRSISRAGGIMGSDGRGRAGTILAPRAKTSMADYRDIERDEPRTAPLRLQRDRDSSVTRIEPNDRAGSSLARYSSPALMASADRFSSPFASRRLQAGSTISQTVDHNRMIQDALVMFEGNVAKLPASSQIHQALMKNAQLIVNGADRLNDQLRSGMSRALDEQVRVEVEESPAAAELTDVWRSVGGDLRDGSRVSDELVRNISLFLLDVGRVFRDLAGPEGHSRSASLDDEGISGRRSRSGLSPEISNGRQSTQSRLSWENVRDKEREDALQRLSSRPDSSLDHIPSALNVLRNRHEVKYETPASKGSLRNTNGQSSSMRRILTSRDGPAPLVARDSQETVHAESSPTPASREQRSQTVKLDRSRTLPPINVPKPVGLLPSEATLRRNQTDRRKTSISIMRSPNFPTISMPTTAVTTTTVTNSPVTFPLLRSDSTKSSDSAGKPTVTFSRPSTVSALNGLQQAHDRDRTNSSSIANLEEASLDHTDTSVERDRRRTLDRSVRLSNAKPADRNATTVSGKTRERRRTVVDIWPSRS